MTLRHAFDHGFNRLRQVFLPVAMTPADRLEAALPGLYLLIALPMVLFFSLRATPLRLVPDEANHLKRIEQLTRLQLVGERQDAHRSGGSVDGAVVQLEAVLESYEQPASLALNQAAAIGWTGREEVASFPNTVQYGPFGYLPQTLSLATVRAMGLGPLDSVRMSRLFTGLCSLGFGFAALTIARRGRAVLFSLLTMPMSMFLAGSLSQDAVILPASLFLLAWISRSQEREGKPFRWFWIVAGLMLVVLGTARPPWLVLGFPLFLAGFGRPSLKTSIRSAVVFAISSALVLGWLWLVRTLQVEWKPGTSAAAQLAFLLSHPGEIPTLLLGSLRGPGWHYLVGDVVGVFGVVQPGLSHLSQVIAFLGLGAALLLEASRSPLGNLRRVSFALACVGGFVLLYLAMYLTWTPVGQLWIEGMQGRYVVPLYAAAALAFQGSLRSGRWRLPAMIVLALVPLAGSVAAILKILALCPS